MSPYSWARADPEFSSMAGWAGRTLSCHSIHSLTEHPSPCKASVLVLCAHSHCSCWGQTTMLCYVGPLHPCSQPQHPLATRQGAAEVLIIFIPGAAVAVPTTGLWRCPPWRLGPLVSPESLRGGLGSGHTRSAVSLPCVLILLCPSSSVPLAGSVVPRMSCDLSQFQCAPVPPFPLEPCPG